MVEANRQTDLNACIFDCKNENKKISPRPFQMWGTVCAVCQLLFPHHIRRCSQLCGWCSHLHCTSSKQEGPGTGYGVGDQGAGAWRSWDSDPGLAVKPVLPESPRWSLHPLGSVKMWGAPRQCGVQSWCGHGGWQASLHPRPLMSRALGVSVCQDLVQLPNSAKVEAA